LNASFRTLYPNLASLVDDGCNLEIHGGGYHFDLAAICEDERQICTFECSGMRVGQIFKKLEKLAKKYREEGVVSDLINGEEYRVD